MNKKILSVLCSVAAVFLLSVLFVFCASTQEVKIEKSGGSMFISKKLGAAACSSLIEEAKRQATDALYVEQGGEVVCSYYSGQQEKVIEVQSITKAVTSSAILNLVATGNIPSLDVPVCNYFPSWDYGHHKEITLRHVLQHRSGVLDSLHTPQEIMAAKDSVAFALSSSLTYAPGKKYRYSNKTANILSGIVEKVTGKTLCSYVQEVFFDAAGIKEFRWTSDPSGHTYGMGGLKMKASDVAKIGRLFLTAKEMPQFGPLSVFLAIKDTLVQTENLTYRNFGMNWWIDDQSLLCEWFGRCTAGTKQKSIYAFGWLGQYLYIDRETGIIAVRQKDVESTDFSLAYNFVDFLPLIRTLSKKFH